MSRSRIPRTDNLDKLTKKVNQFESGAIKYDMIPHAQLARLQLIAEGQPKDRLSQELRRARHFDSGGMGRL